MTRIYAVHHTPPQNFIRNDLFQDLLVGVDNNYLGSYAEVRAQLFAHQKLILGSEEMIGFEHYRRRFFFLLGFHFKDPNLAKLSTSFISMRTVPLVYVGDTLFKTYLEERNSFPQIEEMITDSDVIIPRAVPFQVPLRDQYAMHHVVSDFDELYRVAMANPYFARMPELFETHELLHCNMFMMRWDLFEEWMEVFHEIMPQLEHLIAGKTGYQARVLGFLTERLFTVFMLRLRFMYPQLLVAELPILVCEDPKL